MTPRENSLEPFNEYFSKIGNISYILVGKFKVLGNPVRNGESTQKTYLCTEEQIYH